jgi:hypothetical protein
MGRRIIHWGNMRRGGSEHYVARALRRAGHDVLSIDSRSSDFGTVVPLASDRHCDTVLFHQISRDIASHLPKLPRRVATCCWHWDLINPAYDESRWLRAVDIAKACRLFATSDGSCVDRIPGAILLREGAPDDVAAQPAGEEPSCDVVFVGIPYGERSVWLRDLAKHFQRRLVHLRQSFGDDLGVELQRCRIAISPPFPTAPNYWSDRLYRMTAHGICYVGLNVDGMRSDGWQPGVNFVAHDGSTQNLIEVVERTLADDERLRRIAAAGQETTCRLHTFDLRIDELMRSIDAARR